MLIDQVYWDQAEKEVLLYPHHIFRISNPLETFAAESRHHFVHLPFCFYNLNDLIFNTTLGLVNK